MRHLFRWWHIYLLIRSLACLFARTFNVCRLKVFRILDVWCAFICPKGERENERAHIHDFFVRRNFYDRSFLNNSGLMGTERKFGHPNVSSTVFVCVILTFGKEERENRVMHTTADHLSIHPICISSTLTQTHIQIHWHRIRTQIGSSQYRTHECDGMSDLPARLPNVRVCECSNTKSRMT